MDKVRSPMRCIRLRALRMGEQALKTSPFDYKCEGFLSFIVIQLVSPFLM